MAGIGRLSLKAGPVRLRLDRDERDVDWRLVLGIWVDGDYRTDYRGATVIDVGAHKGFFGAYALARGARAVYAFEPSSENYARLARHARTLHDPSRVWMATRAAVGPEDGEADLHLAAQSWQHTLLIDAPQVTSRVGHLADQTERVLVRSMGSILDEHREGRIIVKIDTEGYECAIIAETPPDAWRDVAELFVEVEASAPCSPESVAAQLERAGFVLLGRTAPDVLHFERPS
jgi:FkbM family methyltransferase